jgi:hypothetical protein
MALLYQPRKDRVPPSYQRSKVSRSSDIMMEEGTLNMKTGELQNSKQTGREISRLSEWLWLAEHK